VWLRSLPPRPVLRKVSAIWQRASLSVKGYYAVTGMCLLMSSIVLQKTVRDYQEDAEAARHVE
jgi:uncharacterized membrane protein YiaA